ncbi:ADF1 (YCL058W-A) [Zygosaccharomyces parabailii]|nr:ADF1 (YCL058W-A) [Zygosaccharomyces parabailii]CDH09844.1 uncharacterized protein ZBAI_01628 [Zygosaccharomyces bailii ISA1307]
MPKSGKVSKAARSKQYSQLPRQRRNISHSDKKRTRCKVEQLDREGLLPNELFQLNRQNTTNRSRGSRSSLLAKNLEQGHKEDLRIREKAKAKKQETDNKILEQIEMISGFSL